MATSADARREAIGAAWIAALGVGLRLAFVGAFPTIPFSDFHGLIDFGIRLRDHGLAAPGYGWVQYSPGLPLALSALFRIFPSDPEGAARAATAVVTGLTGLAPFVLWRPIVARRWRLLAGLALALWPGQVVFSGVVAQENWVLLPVVALACLGVRGARDPSLRTRPVAAGLLYAAAGAIRQEFLVVLLPLVFPAAGAWPRHAGALRRLVLLGAAAGIPLLLLAAERGAASGRFALTTEHGGLGFLGTVVPGAAADFWIDPKMYVAARRPELLRDREAVREAATGFALAEWRRRWRYHAFRSGVSAMRLLTYSDEENLFWSVGAVEALPADRRESGAAFASRWGTLLRVELASLTGLFAAAVLLGAKRRDTALLLLAVAVLLKLALQVVVSPMGRLMVPTVALEVLAAALAASSLERVPRRGRMRLLGVAAGVAALLLLATPPLRALARRKDEAPAPVRRFPLQMAGGGFAECRIEAGRLVALEWRFGHLALAPPPSAPRESARVTCELPPARGPLRLGLQIAQAPPGFAGRLLERVEADGRELLAREVGGLPGTTRVEVPLAQARSVSAEVLALRDDPAPDGGPAPSIRFEIGAP